MIVLSQEATVRAGPYSGQQGKVVEMFGMKEIKGGQRGKKEDRSGLLPGGRFLGSER